MHTPWTQTVSGHYVDLINPQPHQIHIRDIAEQLAKIARFNGCTTSAPYSVAEHSVWVASWLMRNARTSCDERNRRIALYGLLHDAHEAYIGDISTPVKKAMAERGAADTLAGLARPLDRVIYRGAGLDHPMPPDIHTIVKYGDQIALATERRDLLAPQIGTPPQTWEDENLPEPAPEIIKPKPWHRAMDDFLTLFRALRTPDTTTPIMEIKTCPAA